MKVLISAGHSTVFPKDPGACANGYTEAALAVVLRDKIAAIMRSRGIVVLEDGADGISDPLKKAIALIKQCPLAVEIHFNSSEKTSATGVEVLALKQDRQLAQKLSKAISDATGIRVRGGDGGYRPDNSGQHQRLGFCKAGGLVIEVCFISNKKDLAAYLANLETVALNLADVLTRAAGYPLPVVPAFRAIGDLQQLDAYQNFQNLHFQQNAPQPVSAPAFVPAALEPPPSVPANETPASDQTEPVSLNVEDWKPWVFGKLKLIWKSFFGTNFTQGGANLFAAVKSGEYWYIPVLIGVAFFILSLLIAAVLSLVLLSIWYFNRREIGQSKILEAQSKLDPSTPTLHLNIEKIGGSILRGIF